MVLLLPSFPLLLSKQTTYLISPVAHTGSLTIDLKSASDSEPIACAGVLKSLAALHGGRLALCGGWVPGIPRRSQASIQMSTS